MLLVCKIWSIRKMQTTVKCAYNYANSVLSKPGQP